MKLDVHEIRIIRLLQLLLALATVLCIGLGAPPLQAQATAAQVSGRVVEADSGAPIAGAKVYLNSGLPDRACCISVQSDANGDFSFGDLPDGNYYVSASAKGFLTADYGLDENAPRADRRQKVDATTRLRIDFRLLRTASINGVAVNPDGTPARLGVSVQAIRVGKRNDGAVEYRAAGVRGRVAADGSFALDGLKPATYLVCVNCAARVDETLAITSFGDLGRMFYGDTDSAEKASPITLREGETRGDLRITVGAMKLYNVIVKPSGPEGGPLPKYYEVHLFGYANTRYANARSSGFRTLANTPLASGPQKAERQPDGTYLVRNLQAGHYSLFGYATEGPNGTGIFGEGEAEIDVADSDLTLPMSIGAHASAQGTATLDGQPAQFGQDEVVGVQGLPTDPMRGSGAWSFAHVGADGSFRITDIVPGAYTFKMQTIRTPSRNPSGLTLQSVQCNGAEVTQDAPLIVGDSQQIICQATLQRNGGR